MTRISLTEAYDDRSVIAKLNKMADQVNANTETVGSAEESARQSAQSAQETADRFAGSVGAVVQNANAQINASKALVDQAKAEADAAVTTVAQAVQTANQASASAQASAQTVAGYDGRLTEVESDLNAVTLRVTTAEGQIVTIQGRVTALETADGENVKLTGTHAIGNYAVLLTGNQNLTGFKYLNGAGMIMDHKKIYHNVQNNVFYEVFDAPFPSGDARVVIECVGLSYSGAVQVTQVGSGVSQQSDVYGSVSTNGYVTFDMVVENGRRKLYVKKTTAGDVFIEIKNFNIAGSWQGVTMTEGYVVRE